MQTNAEKCREMQKNAEQRMQRNAEKYREMTFMTIMTLNVIFDILEPQHLENLAHVGSYRFLKNLVEF